MRPPLNYNNWPSIFWRPFFWQPFLVVTLQNICMRPPPTKFFPYIMRPLSIREAPPTGGTAVFPPALHILKPKKTLKPQRKPKLSKNFKNLHFSCSGLISVSSLVKLSLPQSRDDDGSDLSQSQPFMSPAQDQLSAKLCILFWCKFSLLQSLQHVLMSRSHLQTYKRLVSKYERLGSY